jgi:hypothetical protein
VRRALRSVVVAAALVAGATGLAGLAAAPAQAAALQIGACTTTSGVVVAVDFGHWGGPVLRSCGSTPTTGFALVNQGGWRTAGTSHDGPGFVCRIGFTGYHGGEPYPTKDEEACVQTPPASAYWSYWHADPGQNTWSYSEVGAMSYHPKPGSVDLWTFGATNVAGTQGVPTIAPSALRATNAQPTPTPSKKPPTSPATPTTPTTRPSHATPTASASATSTHAATNGPVAPGASSPAASRSASTVLAGGSSGPSAGPTVLNADPAASSATRSSAGSPVPAIVGLLVVAGVGVAAAVARLRRHRADR